MSEEGTKRCVVAYATREHQYLWTVDLPERATIADALEVARGLAAATLTTAATRQDYKKCPGTPRRWESSVSRENGRRADRRRPHRDLQAPPQRPPRNAAANETKDPPRGASERSEGLPGR